MSVANNLGERAILVRLSAGLPGEQRQDARLTSTVRSEKGLGSGSGKWVKNLYPPEALAPIKKLDNEARAYHAAVTLPFDTGIGILPAPLIMEHSTRMKQFASMRDRLRDEFLADPQTLVDWAVREHNGTFDPGNYPGCSRVDTVSVDGLRSWVVDAAAFRADMGKRFYFKTEILPVPNAAHFESTIASLIGTDTETVNLRVRDAAVEAQREVMRRMLGPVQAMAAKFAELPKGANEDIIFRDTLVENIREIARIAPALNLGADTQIDKFVADMRALVAHDGETLRKRKDLRSDLQKKADDLAKRMAAYKI